MSKSLIRGWYDISVKYKVYSGLYSRRKFVNMLFPNAGDNDIDITRGSFFRDNQGNDFFKMKSYYTETLNKTDIVIGIKAYIREIVNGSLRQVVDELIKLLREQDTHDNRKARFLAQQGDFLHVDDHSSCSEWLYFYAYFAITRELVEQAGLYGYLNFTDDLQEYEDQVMLPYGNWGNPGLSKIISLATRENPNIVALYEMGEMAYYGRAIYKVPDHNKAYECYLKILEMNEYHPLANWSIAYMMFYYRKETKEIEHAVIDKFELMKLNELQWFSDIITKAEKAYDYGSAAAANLIGNIIEAPEEVFPAKLKGRLQNSLSVEYYEQSARRGNIYGMNNYAMKLIERARKTSEVTVRERILIEAIAFLKKSGNSGSVWASNKIGLFYLNGFRVDNSIVIEKNKHLAYQYFKNAKQYASDIDYFWPTINLIDHFYSSNDEKYSDIMGTEEQIQLLTEFRDKLYRSKCNNRKEVISQIEAIDRLMVRLDLKSRA